MNESTKDLLTLKEMHEASQARIHEIAREFTSGFKFLEKIGRSVSFFGSAKFDSEHESYKDARMLGNMIAEKLGYAVITGGGPGIMEAANRGAYEAGGRSVGMTIRLPMGQITNEYLTDHLDFYYFFSRKVCLGFASEAFVFYPGGYGTLDELFEILTLIQSRKIENVPVFLVGSSYWNEVDEFIKKTLLARGTIDREDLSIYEITDSHAAIVEKVRNHPMREFPAFNHKGGLPKEAHSLGRHCEPCDKKTPPLPHEKAQSMTEELNHWQLNETSIEKSFVFKNFSEALSFVNAVGEIAEAEGHHPDISILNWNHVKIVLTTHAIGNLSDNDFILASKIDAFLDGNE